MLARGFSQGWCVCVLGGGCLQGLHMLYSLTSDVKSLCIRVSLLGSFSLVFYPLPSHPSWLGKYVVSILVSTAFPVSECLVVAAHRVVMDTLRIRLGVIFGSTFLSGTIPQAHLLLMGLNSLEVKYLATTSSITSLKNKKKKINV